MRLCHSYEIPWGLFVNLWTLLRCVQSLVLPLVFACSWTGVISAKVLLILKHFQHSHLRLSLCQTGRENLCRFAPTCYLCIHFLLTCLSTCVSCCNFLLVFNSSRDPQENKTFSPLCAFRGSTSINWQHFDRQTMIGQIWLRTVSEGVKTLLPPHLKPSRSVALRQALSLSTCLRGPSLKPGGGDYKGTTSEGATPPKTSRRWNCNTADRNTRHNNNLRQYRLGWISSSLWISSGIIFECQHNMVTRLHS